MLSDSLLLVVALYCHRKVTHPTGPEKLVESRTRVYEFRISVLFTLPNPVTTHPTPSKWPEEEEEEVRVTPSGGSTSCVTGIE
tara:strand:+ start:2171 stop:2419 length:249 start_codon:yes stop_codon:yes gene_type:complete